MSHTIQVSVTQQPSQQGSPLLFSRFTKVLSSLGGYSFRNSHCRYSSWLCTYYVTKCPSSRLYLRLQYKLRQLCSFTTACLPRNYYDLIACNGREKPFFSLYAGSDFWKSSILTPSGDSCQLL
uniref:Uncharacterized protein n=1 Tax=Arundo donax TaxID=35708 RepID=A0A0A9H3M5_ARUDO